MKEFSLTFDKGLQTGLRRNSNNPRNSEALTELYNAKPGELGLEAFVPITNPISDSIGTTISWPFPQLFIGEDYTVLATATKIYDVDSSWDLTEKLTVTTGEAWDFIDFGPFFAMLNGSVIVYIDLGTIATPITAAYAQMTYSSTFPRFSTGCNFKGQIVGGNVKTTWHGCGTNSVIWSKIGSVVFTPDLTNEAGFREMPWEGEVLRVMRLGDHVAVYGDNGIAILSPRAEPTLAFGMRQVAAYGIQAKGAVGGDESVHFFIDNKDRLWKLTADLKAELLDYREYMATLTAANVRLVYNPGLQELFIGDGSGSSYLLTRWGLCEVIQRITSVNSAGEYSYGVCENDSTTGYGQFRLTSDVIDFGIRGLKTIGVVELGASMATQLQVALDWRSDATGSFGRTDFINTDPVGGCAPVVTAAEFRLCVKSSAYAGVDLDHIIMRTKLSDKRFARGMRTGMWRDR